MASKSHWDLPWRGRPVEEAINLNPAFCGELILKVRRGRRWRPHRVTRFCSACKHRMRSRIAASFSIVRANHFLPAAIRDGLPYFLGAVDERHVLTLRRYQDARARLRKLERELTESQALSDQTSSTVQSLCERPET